MIPKKVKLNKLSGDQWIKTTRRAKAAEAIRRRPVRLHAQRQRLGGHAHRIPWQQEFEDKFEYQETERPTDRPSWRATPIWRSLCPWTGCSAAT